MRKRSITALLLAVMLTSAACSVGGGNEPSPSTGTATPSPSTEPTETPSDAGQTAENSATTPPDDKGPSPSPTTSPKPDSGNKESSSGKGSSSAGESAVQVADNADSAVQVTANAEAATALVNKQFRLPKGYVPDDLVYPNIPFIFSEKVDKRKLRKDAAEALEKLVAGAKKDDIKLAGVSGYRSEARQKTLFTNYVKKDGIEAASKYSARPGHSEHQTGLSMDVSGVDGKCAAESCFGDTPEADWLAKNAADYGFIIRYPEGKQDITGYKYEPWHIRYVGVELARKLEASGDTLEEHYGAAVPVSGSKN
ncbi:D-alanyl-D-alanine carboxypeptidase [Paenibacillaceae bacterium GAS479]|nr:D-alanyl-D-alanine carboxypeptidase [Paenibacillaceae bacterium GAS479]